MFCPNCGTPCEDGMTFCPQCGSALAATPAQPTVTAEEPVQATPSFTEAPIAETVAMEAPIAPKSKKGLLAKILIAVGAVALVAVLVFVCLTVFASPKSKVSSAFGKTAAAYDSMLEKLDLDGLEEFEDRAFTDQLDLTLDVDGERETVALSSSVDMQARKMLMKLDLSGEIDLSANVALYDKLLAVSLANVENGKYYGVDTETLGDDLQSWGFPSETASLNFNLYDVIESLKSDDSAMKEANKALLNALVVEKGESTEKTVNSYDCKGTTYTVTVPEKALNAYFKALLKNQESLLASTGLLTGEETLSDDDIDVLTETIGTLTLDVFVSGGYISELSLDVQVEDQTLSLVLQLGGGKNYVDDFSLSLSPDGSRDNVITLASTGDHTASNGTFSDKTTLTLVDDGDEETLLRMNTSWSPDEEQDNLKVSLTIDEDVEIVVNGALTVEKGHLIAALDKLTVEGEPVGLSLRYEKTAADALAFDETVEQAENLFDMSDDDIQQLLIAVLMNNQWLLG